MTNFLQTVSRHASFAGLSGATAFTRHADAAQRDEAEYQIVFAVTAALLAGGATVVLSALSQTLT